MSLSACFPVEVPVTLGGVTFLVGALTLADLGWLEAWARLTLAPPATDETLDRLGLGDPATYAEALRDAYRHADDWPPSLGDPRIDHALFETIPGRAMMLLCAGKNDPTIAAIRQALPLGFDQALAAQLAEVTAEEWDAFDLVVMSLDPSPFLGIVRRINAFVGFGRFATLRESGNSGSGVPWTKAIAETCLEYGMSPAELGQLTLGQWHILRSGGKPRERFEPEPADSMIAEQLADALCEFWAHAPAVPLDDDDDQAGNGGESNE